MCGFVGYLIPQGKPRPDLAVWSQIVLHRGPDSGGTYHDGPVGFGFRRLAIQDLSEAGNQPMQGERFTLMLNGEIYNQARLRQELATPAGGWRGHSDTETVLQAFEQWGLERTLGRLNGMYALAVWDKHKQELTLVRDPLGVKPLLYLEHGGSVYFASELRALRPHSRGRLSAQGVALYAALGFVPAPFSLLEDVKKLRPGEVRVFGRQPRSGFIQYGAWQEARDVEPGDLRAAVERAVEGQLLSDVPVGIFLSGGVDSSAIAHVVARTGPLASFSLRPLHGGSPEAELDADLAAAQAKKLGLEHHEIPFDPAEVAQDPADLLARMDEPVLEPYFRGEVLLSQAARAAGVIVVLTGHGGDEVFMGYPTYQAVEKGERYDRIPLLGPALRAASSLPFLPGDARDNLRGAASVWRQPFLEGYARRSAVLFDAATAARLAGLPAAEVGETLRALLEEAHGRAQRLPSPAGRPLRPVELAARMDLLFNVPEHYNQRLDRASMNASVEARVPLQDLDLLDCVLRLGAEALMDGGLKGLMKQSFAELPREVLHRPKRHFQAPLLGWLREGGALEPWARSQLKALGQRLGQRLPEARVESTQAAYQTWSLALLEGWARQMQLDTVPA
ncbi:asparagine synthase (glutamine-hydrolyzing) [Calidithermus chliarophilus]|uniref:asparagine synthase (glutamine-hydrolyzing) n=1 Tax=Calidithermus chliarophilus TaxID=52023 RepID=UPI0003F5A1D2|nr:asparagine synthase (glutamine-hydrolyzing) [Calidithermus chliarophilus]